MDTSQFLDWVADEATPLTLRKYYVKSLSTIHASSTLLASVALTLRWLIGFDIVAPAIESQISAIRE
jgi:hypothetical protein